MFQKFSKLGSVLNKTEQKMINGGLRPNSDNLVCHKSDRFPPNACPTGYFYSTTWNACCHHVTVDLSDPIAL
ncbi:hypothetical protein D1816_04315 [Aquimarina sp. AD10]|uniref:hypothetical protein n=1 Tax=Aquimarina TaxID=290174 RepID=UPI000E4B1B92|nr:MULTISPECIES: hypothetical protein [Aquimarina]AXT59609.1 hypothetical protein D1816_04315 [Aquimarina sp. AD10]RKM94710.1 hypothetical protein D7033_17875 [Aquimarina sp. AD10]